MLFFIQQLLSIMLAVNIDQMAPQYPQLRHRNRPPAYPTDIFPIRSDLTLQHQITILVRHDSQISAQLGSYMRKQCADKSLVRTGTDQVAGSPLPQNGTHGIDHNGLAGACFTCQRVKSRFKSDLRLFNDGNILNMKQFQHPIPAFQRSICFTCSQKSNAWVLS